MSVHNFVTYAKILKYYQLFYGLNNFWNSSLNLWDEVTDINYILFNQKQ